MTKNILVSDETYEKIKDQLVKDEFEYYENYVLVRSHGAGCFAGVLKYKDDSNRVVLLTNCRRLWYWDGAASLSQLAMEGVNEPANCKFPQETKEHTVYDILEIIESTKEAQKNIREVWVWKK